MYGGMYVCKKVGRQVGGSVFLSFCIHIYMRIVSIRVYVFNYSLMYIYIYIYYIYKYMCVDRSFLGWIKCCCFRPTSNGPNPGFQRRREIHWVSRRDGVQNGRRWLVDITIDIFIYIILFISWYIMLYIYIYIYLYIYIYFAMDDYII